jgi:peptidoglycan/LPS O-acetylase OafA/YrhL
MPEDITPDDQAQPSVSKRADIQGLRAVAVILVAFHAGLPIRGGFIGVDVFLVISGFVIMGVLTRELERTGTIRFRNFYSRRIKRLLPALALMTTVVVAASAFLGSPFGSQQTTAKTALGATSFSANLVILHEQVGYFTPSAALDPLLHTWTLSVEEQVYLVSPALLLGSWIVGRWLLRASKRGAATMLLLVTTSSFLLCLLLSFGLMSAPGIGDGERFAFYSSITRIWEFAIGAALASGTSRLERVPRKIARAASDRLRGDPVAVF